jgi:hypothetical protein
MIFLKFGGRYMEIGALRDEVLTRVQRLSAEELKIVNAFIAFLEAEANPKTEEPIKTDIELSQADKEVIESFKRSWLEAQSGRVRPIHELEWN